MMEADAKALLAEHGRTLKLRRVTAADYTPGVGKEESDTTKDVNITVYLAGYKDKQINGTSILQKDRKAIIAAKGLSPAPKFGDLIIDGTTKYNIIDSNTVYDKAVPVVYICQARV